MEGTPVHCGLPIRERSQVEQTSHGHRRSVESAPNRPPTENHASPAMPVPANRRAIFLRVISCGTSNQPVSDAEYNPLHALMAVRSSRAATFRRAGPLCLSLPLGCSQRDAVFGGLLIRRPHAPLQFTSNHTGLYLLTRERLQSSDVFLRPRTQFRSLRHLSSLSTAVADHRSLSQDKKSHESAALSLHCTLSRAIRVSRGDVDNCCEPEAPYQALTSKATRSCRSYAPQLRRESRHICLRRFAALPQFVGDRRYNGPGATIPIARLSGQ